jgi:phage-related protein
MAETLLIVPSYATQAVVDQKATVVSFGDGYEQRTPTGINSKRLSYRLVWDRVTYARARAAAAFFYARGNTEAFLWTPPAPWGDGGPLQWVARIPFGHTHVAYDCETVEVQIDQDFNPLP